MVSPLRQRQGRKGLRDKSRVATASGGWERGRKASVPIEHLLYTGCFQMGFCFIFLAAHEAGRVSPVSQGWGGGGSEGPEGP